MRALALVLVVVGCYRPASFDVDPCAITCNGELGCPDGHTCNPMTGRCGIDCNVVDLPDARDPDGSECYGSTSLVRICPPPPIDNDNLLFEAATNHSIGTEDDDPTELCDFHLPQSTPGTLPLCVVVANQINISGFVRFHGANPVVLFAHESILVDGALDLSTDGAGADPEPDCVSTPGNAGTPEGGAGGGAGGSFASRGGDGGFGVTTAVAQPELPANALVSVRGGCDGGAGGGSADVVTGGAGGRGGGAVWLLSPGSIQISGVIQAIGVGGKGAPVAGTGGGGGGAGGLIAIEAMTVHIPAQGRVAAHGGGGGGGSDGTGMMVSGTDGEPGNTTGVPAKAGDGSGMGFDGGAGSPNAQPGRATGAVDSGGGGGGGGQGFIFLIAPTQSVEGMVFPPVLPDTTSRR